jgi:hypothetical protein
VELALWDRFGWGPDQTSKLSLSQLRLLFAVMEQQRVSKDAIENLGSPDFKRIEAKMLALRAAEKQQESQVANAKVIRRDLQGLGG